MSNDTRKLTRKQQIFVDAYLSNGYNGTQAAITAGYSVSSAHVTAHDNLNLDYIVDVINSRLSGNPPKYSSIPERRKSCYLYLMRAANGFVKVGVTSDVKKRLKEINVASPIEVTLLHAFPDIFARSSEDELHRLFSDRHVKGEWYALTEDDIEIIRRRYGRKQGS